jgi:hypothetical protein
MSTQFFQCKTCGKTYSSKQSLCNHTRIKHKHSNDTYMATNVPLGTINTPINILNNTPDITTNMIFKCNYCDNVYKYKQGKYRHQKVCKFNNTDVITQLKSKVSELENKITNMNTTNTTNNGHMNHGTIVNGQLNNGPVNNNYIIKFGAEDLSAILSKEDMIKICNKKFTAIEESIKMTHFNKNKPELNNVIIKNLRDEYAYVHDGESYIVQDKNDIIADLIELHLDNIEMIINEENENNIRNKLDKKVIERLESLRDRLDDESEIKINEKRYENYKSYKINQIKLLIYNCINKLKIIMNK